MSDLEWKFFFFLEKDELQSLKWILYSSQKEIGTEFGIEFQNPVQAKGLVVQFIRHGLTMSKRLRNNKSNSFKIFFVFVILYEIHSLYFSLFF